MAFPTPTNFAFGHSIAFGNFEQKYHDEHARADLAEAKYEAKLLECAVLAEECNAAKVGQERAQLREKVALEQFRELVERHQNRHQNPTMGSEAELDDLKVRLATAQNRISNHEASIKQLEDEAEESEKQLKAEQAAHHATKLEKNELSKSIDEKEKYIADLEERLAGCEEDKEKFKNIEAQLDAEKRNARDAEARRADVANQFQQLKDDTRPLRAQVTSLENQLQTTRNELQQANAMVAQLQDVEEQVTAEKDAIINGLSTQVAGLQHDAKSRINILPHAHRDPADIPGPRDLNQELGDVKSSTTSDASNASNDGHDDSDASTATDGSDDREGNGDNTRIIHIPGPVVRIPQVITQIVLDYNPLTAWSVVERNTCLLVFIFISWLIRFFMPKAMVDPDPVTVPAPGDFHAAISHAGIVHGVSMMGSSLAVGSMAAPGGPVPGSDPNDPDPATNPVPSGPSGQNLEDLLSPINKPADDEREQFQQLDNANGNDNGNGMVPSRPLTPPAEEIRVVEDFFDFRSAQQPPIIPTILGLLFHLAVYYFVYVCFCVSFERKIWQAANESTRAFLHHLLYHRNRYPVSIFHHLFSDGVAARIDRLALLFVQLFGVQIQSYPLPG